MSFQTIRKILAYVILFSFLTALMLVVNMPARWLYSQFVQAQVEQLPIKVAVPQGTALAGSTQLMSAEGQLPVDFFVQKLHWKWRPLGLIKGQIVYDLSVQDIQLSGKPLGDYAIEVGWHWGDYFANITDLNALLDLDAKVTISDAERIISGTVHLNKEDTQIQTLLNAVPMIAPDGSFAVNF